MAKYQQYEEYKDSKIESLGMLPSHWVVKSLSKATKRISVGLATSVTEYYRDEGIPIIRNMNIKEGYFDGSDMLYLDPKFAKANSGKVVFKGDVIAVHTGSNLGLACIVPDEFNNCHTFTTLIVTTHKYLLNRYLTYCINSAYGKAEVNRLKFGFGKDNLNVKEFNFFYTILPEFDEQLKIANFLDHETAQIDTLIEKQQTLIQLLKEKRQAVISHAVTKGLNPDAPMKDSGVEWLGEVPEHWEVSKLKYYSSIQGGYAFSSDSFTEEGVQILKIGNVYQNRLALERQPTFVPEVMLEALPDFIVKDGDILMSLTGTLGKRDYGFAVAIKDDGKYLLNQRVAKLNPADEKIDRDFLLNVLWSESYLNQLYSLPSGTKQANLSNSDVLDIVITLPPSKTEQKEIAVELRNQKDIFDKAIQKAMTSIELMQERRTALISAAVTGKIDVRGWRASE